MFSRLLLVCLAALALPTSTVAQSFARTQPKVEAPSALAVERLQSIDHFVVIMLENESFDQLFPNVRTASIHPHNSIERSVR